MLENSVDTDEMTHRKESHICLHYLPDCPFYRTLVLYFINEKKVKYIIKLSVFFQGSYNLPVRLAQFFSEAPSQNPPATRPCFK